MSYTEYGDYYRGPGKIHWSNYSTRGWSGGPAKVRHSFRDLSCELIDLYLYTCKSKCSDEKTKTCFYRFLRGDVEGFYDLYDYIRYTCPKGIRVLLESIDEDVEYTHPRGNQYHLYHFGRLIFVTNKFNKLAVVYDNYCYYSCQYDRDKGTFVHDGKEYIIKKKHRQ